MDLAENLKQQIKELNSFVKKQANHIQGRCGRIPRPRGKQARAFQERRHREYCAGNREYSYC